MIKVLIVEDSPVMQHLLSYTISSDPSLHVAGIAANGEEAIEAVRKLKPDIIAMDWQMPKLDGEQATRIIMENDPVPIVIVSGCINDNDIAISFKMVEAGALAIVRKPPAINHPNYKAEAEKLNQALKLMSEIKLVRRYNLNPVQQTTNNLIIKTLDKPKSPIKLIAIGASTGGPIVLQNILLGLPVNIPVPILIVQHISNGFAGGFAEWLKNTTKFPIHIANHGEIILPGHCYIPPDDYHMGIDNTQRIYLSKQEPENGLRPAISYLFRTVSDFIGSSAVGILLTGMGNDGAKELKLMHDRGSVTFAQDKESSVIHGMPGEAIRLGGATHVLSPQGIISALNALIFK